MLQASANVNAVTLKFKSSKFSQNVPQILTHLIWGDSWGSEESDRLLATFKAQVLCTLFWFESLQMFWTMISVSHALDKLARVDENSGFCMIIDSSSLIFTYTNLMFVF